VDRAAGAFIAAMRESEHVVNGVVDVGGGVDCDITSFTLAADARNAAAATPDAFLTTSTSIMDADKDDKGAAVPSPSPFGEVPGALLHVWGDATVPGLDVKARTHVWYLTDLPPQTTPLQPSVQTVGSATECSCDVHLCSLLCCSLGSASEFSGDVHLCALSALGARKSHNQFHMQPHTQQVATFVVKPDEHDHTMTHEWSLRQLPSLRGAEVLSSRGVSFRYETQVVVATADVAATSAVLPLDQSPPLSMCWAL
jgi:hypothetical protein